MVLAEDVTAKDSLPPFRASVMVKPTKSKESRTAML